MGSVAILKLNDLEIFESKGGIYPPDLIYLFSHNEKIFIDMESDDIIATDPYRLEFRANTRYVNARLDVMGFTINAFRRRLEQYKGSLKSEAADFFNGADMDLANAAVLNAAPEDYISMFKYVYFHKIYYFDIPNNRDLPPLLQYAKSAGDDLYWGLPYEFFFFTLRIMLESAGDDAILSLDASELYSNGYVDSDGNQCDNYSIENVDNIESFDKIVILTEGTTDLDILKRSLALLYPHIVQCYSFLDYELKPAFGVGNVVSMVKSFASAGIKNKIVAVVDADSESLAATMQLKGLKMPRNIVYIKYPHMSLFDSYPCIGPNGIENCNVYDRACSIEMYLGRDVLEIEGVLTPIEWRNCNSAVGQWHGVLQKKEIIKKRFFKKLSKCEEDRSQIGNSDWSAIQSILTSIFKAFEV